MGVVHLRKYGEATTINFELFEVDGVDLRINAVHAAGDTSIMKDEGVEANTTNGFVDEGNGYSLALTATEMQAARIVVYVVDQTATKVWLDRSIYIETYGHASAQHAFDLDTANVTLAAATHTGAVVPTVTTLTGHTAQTGDNYAVLASGIAALAHNNTLIEQLQTLIAVIEHQRGAHTHQPIGDIFFVDPVNGNTHASGNRGGITDPYLGVQDCHDNAVTDSNHDLIILLSGAAAGPTTLTENVTISKRYTFIRGPGRDFNWTRSGAGDTITVTADGVELAGFQLNTAVTGAGNGITVTSADFFRAYKLWVNDTRGDGIQLTDCDNFVIEACSLQGSGASGAGHGVQVLAGAGQTGNYGVIKQNYINDVQGDGIQIDTTGGGTIDATIVEHNVIQGCTDDGVDIVDSGCTDTIIRDNRFGNNTNDIEDVGTNTVIVNNEQWAQLPKQGVALNDIQFLWVAASDGRTPVTGATGTSVTRSIDGAAYGAATGTLSEVGNGTYSFDASIADMSGGKITFRFAATGGTPGAPDDAFVTVITDGGV